jgi:hypothetical protein
VYGEQSGGLRGGRPVPHRGDVQPGDRHVQQSREAGRDKLQRRQPVHANRHVRGRGLRWRQPEVVHGERSVPHRGDVQSGDRHLQQSRKGGRDSLQRWECVHANRHVRGRGVRWR